MDGTIVYLAGCTAIAHFVAISIERAATLLNPLWSITVKGHTPCYIIAMIAICWAYGSFWSIMPLVGESEVYATTYLICYSARIRTWRCLIFIIALLSCYRLPAGSAQSSSSHRCAQHSDLMRYDGIVYHYFAYNMRHDTQILMYVIEEAFE